MTFVASLVDDDFFLFLQCLLGFLEKFKVAVNIKCLCCHWFVLAPPLELFHPLNASFLSVIQTVFTSINTASDKRDCKG